MKRQRRSSSVCDPLALVLPLALFVAILIAVSSAYAQPAAPTPLRPAPGSTVIIPTFSWLPPSGWAKHEIQVGPQSDPNLVYWSGITRHLTLTPNDGQDLPNVPLYWRVRAIDAEDTPGPWSARVNFVKHIPAPKLLAPFNHVAVPVPRFEWSAAAGATHYRVQVSKDPTFNLVDYTFTSYNTILIPVGTLAPATYYWRVAGLDQDDHAGTWSVVRSYLQCIPAPVLVAPAKQEVVASTYFAWEPVEGAASYVVELSQSESFIPIVHTYRTYGTKLVPVDPLAPGTYYWRVRGEDADDHQGTNSDQWIFTQALGAPDLLRPASGSKVSLPVLEWVPVAEAVKYRVEVTTDATFSAISATLTTYNARLTPVDTLSLNTYYWRVQGLDADDHGGAFSQVRSFGLIAPSVAVDNTPQLQFPLVGEVISDDPSYVWSSVSGAAEYRILVSANAAFSGLYDAVTTDYPSYTPFTPGTKHTYINGTYFWKVEARRSNGSVISTSAARSFTRQAGLALAGPADGAVVEADPLLEWTDVPGAEYYRLVVSRDPGFGTAYDSVSTHLMAYAPYIPGTKHTYQNGTYYWRVEARSSADATIVTSPARSFTRQAQLTLHVQCNPDGATRDPEFSWNPVAGAVDYRLVVSRDPAFGTSYDSTSSEYTGYCPYTPGSKHVYASGTYYARIEAKSPADASMVTSAAVEFHKELEVPLLEPPDGTVMGGAPLFAWEAVPGAARYRLVVSREADFSSTYDTVKTDYTTYTPYTPGTRDLYAAGTYYWRVEAESSASANIATSLVRVFTVSGSAPTSTPIGAPTATNTRVPTVTPTRTLVPGTEPSPTSVGPRPTAGATPMLVRQVGEVAIYADGFTDLGNNVWHATGHVRLGDETAARVDLAMGSVTYNTQDLSISGSSDSTVSLMMTDRTLNPVFAGPFSVDSQTGRVSVLGSFVSRLTGLGDLGVDMATPLADVVVDVLEGTVAGQATVTIYGVEDEFPCAEIQFTLYQDGHVSGSLGVDSLEFEAAGVTFEVQDAAFSYDEVHGGAITIGNASVTLPEEFCPLQASGSVEDLVITSEGLEGIGGVEVTVKLPELDVPGTGGKFKVAGAEVTLGLGQDGDYFLHGRADFTLPNVEVRKTDQEVGLFVEFQLDQRGLVFVSLGGSADPGIPIGTSGFQLTKLEGRVQLEPTVLIAITGAIQSELEVKPLGPALSGEPYLIFDMGDDPGIEIGGEVQVLIFKAAEASLSLRQHDGLRGEVTINYIPYGLSGDARLHVWRAGGEFHFTGSATVRIGFDKGALGEKWGIDLPPFDTSFGEVGLDFGEFCDNDRCTSTVYGFKGHVEVSIEIWVPRAPWNWPPAGRWKSVGVGVAFFVDTDGDLDFGTSLDEYRLVDQATAQAEAQAAGLALTSTNVISFEVPSTDLIMVGLEWQQGSPTFRLLDPEGISVTKELPYPDCGYTYTARSLVYFIENPKPGVWQAEVGNLAGNEGYSFGCIGENPPPVVTVTGIAPAGESAYTVSWTATDTDDNASVALYYDEDNSGNDGTLISRGLDLSLGSYTWTTTGVKTGSYYVYARVDDLKNVPVVAYSAAPVSVIDQQPPSAVTGLRAQFSLSQNRLRACWNRNPEPDVVGYNVYLGTRAGVYDLGRFDVSNLSCTDLPLPDWFDRGAVAVAAYDSSANEGPLTELLLKRSFRLSLPLVVDKR